MRVLMIGDIVGKPGRHAVGALVPGLRSELRLDVVVANGENAAAGKGLTSGTAKEILAGGVDVITSGNHIWAQREVIALLDSEAPVLRPANYPEGAPGRGIVRFAGLTVINLMGRTFMYEIDDPFRAADRLLEGVEPGSPVLVDMHAEATSEKIAMGWHLDGRVTAVIGTHTHVQTADERVLPGGTAYLTDAGMTGPHDSIIGMEKEPSLTRFLNGMPAKFEPASGNPRLNGAVIEADDKTGRATKITRISYSAEELDQLAVRPAVRGTTA